MVFHCLYCHRLFNQQRHLTVHNKKCNKSKRKKKRKIEYVKTPEVINFNIPKEIVIVSNMNNDNNNSLNDNNDNNSYMNLSETINNDKSDSQNNSIETENNSDIEFVPAKNKKRNTTY